jgi:hypothetical protein
MVTSPIPYRSRAFEVEFDFIDHRLIVSTTDGATRSIALRPQAVADFYREYMTMLNTMGISVKIWPVPVEGDAPIPFLDDRRHASYDPEPVPTNRSGRPHRRMTPCSTSIRASTTRALITGRAFSANSPCGRASSGR